MKTHRIGRNTEDEEKNIGWYIKKLLISFRLLFRLTNYSLISSGYFSKNSHSFCKKRWAEMQDKPEKKGKNGN